MFARKDEELPQKKVIKATCIISFLNLIKQTFYLQMCMQFLC